METPTMFETRSVADDTELLSAYTPVPGMGVLPVNAFLIRSEQPVLVDTGLAALRGTFVKQLRNTIDLESLQWIWVTHSDPDHVGALAQLLVEAPHAKVVTTYLGMGKMGMLGIELAPERVFLLNAGQSLDVGDRRLQAIRPPVYDAPETTGLFDPRTGVLFSSDSFGALMAEPRVSARDLRPDELREGMYAWTSVDAPWWSAIDDGAHRASLDAIRRLDPQVVLSSHLPPARAMIGDLIEVLSGARGAAPFVGPDQAALQAMFAAA